MNENNIDTPKTASQIAAQLEQLTPIDKIYVLRMVNVLLHEQQQRGDVKKK